ncbi:hypothetical protein ABZ897_47955 [Nonomuraea sp. NPDC046802]|uniref:hypothetical protein n=1 Tax=Nonomuraea sp. NPDC046802 TaxID=3154919 RepID=UPI0033D10D55
MRAVLAMPPFAQETVTECVPDLAALRLADHSAVGVPVGVGAGEGLLWPKTTSEQE